MRVFTLAQETNFLLCCKISHNRLFTKSYSNEILASLATKWLQDINDCLS